MKKYKVTINKTYKTYVIAKDSADAKEIAIAKYEIEGGKVYLVEVMEARDE